MKGVSLKDYYFNLPAERIAEYPLDKRDDAKLLVYNKGSITHQGFNEIKYQLPPQSLLVFNNTQVIPARLYLFRETGARIELLLLEPAHKQAVEKVMEAESPVRWIAMIGGKKKWKDDELLFAEVDTLRIEARLLDRESGLVELTWDTQDTFAEVLIQLGKMPLPPYIKREADESDLERYQTIYARKQGAVAAPTAGLHFTDKVMQELRAQGHDLTELTLHVGAGTFQPVKVDDPSQHPMHNERVVVTRETIEILLQAEGPVIPVGTTSMRSLESLFWWGCRLVDFPDSHFFVEKLQGYKAKRYSKKQALEAIVAYMKHNNLDSLSGQTQILIMPGYKFGLCDGLVTNFHLPETTLILLVAAFIGEDWRKVYAHALSDNYRFLSYGDSSLLLP